MKKIVTIKLKPGSKVVIEADNAFIEIVGVTEVESPNGPCTINLKDINPEIIPADHSGVTVASADGFTLGRIFDRALNPKK